MLWTLSGSPSVHRSFRGHSSKPPCSGGTFANIPGRLADPRGFPRIRCTESSPGKRSLQHPRGKGEPRKVRVGTIPEAYLGMVLDSKLFRASPTPERIERFERLAGPFLTEDWLLALKWEKILGMMACLIHLIPGSRLRMRPLQFALKRQWHNKQPRYTAVKTNPQTTEAVSWW